MIVGMDRPLRVVVALAAAIAVALAGCGDAPPQDARAAKDAPRTLRVSGSGSAVRLVEQLAPTLRRLAPDLRLRLLDGTDTRGGIAAVNARTIEVAAVSRRPEPGELEPGVRYARFARDAAVFVANGGGVRSLTSAQLRRAFSGAVTNWKQLGGRDRPIVLVVRDEQESLTRTLRRTVFGQRMRFSRDATVFTSASDIDEALLRTPGALGFTSYGALRVDAPSLTPLAVDGLRPSAHALAIGAYRHTRDMGVVVRPGPMTTRLVDALRSPAVARRLRAAGYHPTR